MKTITLDDEYSYPLHMIGSISTLPAEEENQAVLDLRDVVEEVTGKPVEVPAKPRIGFLP